MVNAKQNIVKITGSNPVPATKTNQYANQRKNHATIRSAASDGQVP